MAMTAAALQLKAACDAAYDANMQSCSNAVWDVIKAVWKKDEPYRTANDLITEMTAKWSDVDIELGYSLANLGKVVVGGKTAVPNGHVVVIYPGSKILNGGYQYYWPKTKTYLTLTGKDLYPRALSTSISFGRTNAWPGTMSKGDKTVWDPWGSDTAFADVTFWTPQLT
jgi:hypothetical protein